MRWKLRPVIIGEKRTIRRFAWWPVMVDKGTERLWLEYYWVEQIIVDTYVGAFWHTDRSLSTNPVEDPLKGESKHVRLHKELPDNKTACQDMLAAGWDGPGWYFWDETDAYCHGPFGTSEEANTAMTKYLGEQL